MVILRKRVAGLSETALERFVLRARRAVRLKGTVNVLVTGGGEVRALNRKFRGKNITTDVLSFPASSAGARGAGRLAGEIAISAEIAARNADQLGHSAADEVKILTLHGILHLAGFDHERDNGEMARREIRLRQQLRLPVGLIERALSERAATERAEMAAENTWNHRGRAGSGRRRARTSTSGAAGARRTR